MVLTQKQRIELYQATGVSLSTIQRWLKTDGKPVNDSTNRTLLKACSELGFGAENEAPPDEVEK
jgi:hypothetical protein